MTTKKPRHSVLGIQVLGQAKNVAGLTPLLRSKLFPSDNWISIDSLPLERPHTIGKNE
jgi:hypothetical protein